MFAFVFVFQESKTLGGGCCAQGELSWRWCVGFAFVLLALGKAGKGWEVGAQGEPSCSWCAVFVL